MATVMATGSRRASRVDEMAVHEKPEVKRGGSIMQQNEHFVEQRTCRDVIWAGLFIILAACVAFGAAWTIVQVFSFENLEEAKLQKLFLKLHENAFMYGMLSMLTAALSAALFSIAFLQFTKMATECVVWTSLILGPMMLICCGAYTMTQSWPLPGCVGVLMVLGGGCLLSCVICCYKDLVPLTVKLLKTAIHVIELHPSMMILCVISSMIAAAWSLACFACLFGLSIIDDEMVHLVKSKASSSPMKAALVFAYAFVYFWGSYVASNAAHTACAGVYGRWYFQKDAGSPVASSLRVAWTTSFGSICYGSFILAVVRAVQALVRVVRQEAEERGDIVTCIILRILECMIDCAGDIIEGISEWAYVQCAVRGVGFCEAAAATPLDAMFAVWYHCGIDTILSSCLIDLVPLLGALIVAGFSGLSGFIVYHYGVPVEGYKTSVFAFCFFIGFLSSYAALMPLKTGSITIIVCFAEESDFLRRKAPALFEALTNAAIDDDESSANSSRRGSNQPNQLQQGGQARDVRGAPLMEMQNVQGQAQR